MADTGSNDAYGINGAIMKRTDPLASTVNTIEVPDIDEYLEKVVNSGGRIVQEKVHIDVGSFAVVSDTEGNLLGLMQPEEATS
jgi:hypothetical protein